MSRNDLASVGIGSLSFISCQACVFTCVELRQKLAVAALKWSICMASISWRLYSWNPAESTRRRCRWVGILEPSASASYDHLSLAIVWGDRNWILFTITVLNLILRAILFNQEKGRLWGSNGASVSCRAIGILIRPPGLYSEERIAARLSSKSVVSSLSCRALFFEISGNIEVRLNGKDSFATLA